MDFNPTVAKNYPNNLVPKNSNYLPLKLDFPTEIPSYSDLSIYPELSGMKPIRKIYVPLILQHLFNLLPNGKNFWSCRAALSNDYTSDYDISSNYNLETIMTKLASIYQKNFFDGYSLKRIEKKSKLTDTFYPYKNLKLTFVKEINSLTSEKLFIDLHYEVKNILAFGIPSSIYCTHFDSSLFQCDKDGYVYSLSEYTLGKKCDFLDTGIPEFLPKYNWNEKEFYRNNPVAFLIILCLLASTEKGTISEEKKAKKTAYAKELLERLGYQFVIHCLLLIPRDVIVNRLKRNLLYGEGLSNLDLLKELGLLKVILLIIQEHPVITRYLNKDEYEILSTEFLDKDVDLSNKHREEINQWDLFFKTNGFPFDDSLFYKLIIDIKNMELFPEETLPKERKHREKTEEEKNLRRIGRNLRRKRKKEELKNLKLIQNPLPVEIPQTETISKEIIDYESDVSLIHSDDCKENSNNNSENIHSESTNSDIVNVTTKRKKNKRNKKIKSKIELSDDDKFLAEYIELAKSESNLILASFHSLNMTFAEISVQKDEGKIRFHLSSHVQFVGTCVGNTFKGKLCEFDFEGDIQIDPENPDNYLFSNAKIKFQNKKETNNFNLIDVFLKSNTRDLKTSSEDLINICNRYYLTREHEKSEKIGKYERLKNLEFHGDLIISKSSKKVILRNGNFECQLNTGKLTYTCKEQFVRSTAIYKHNISQAAFSVYWDYDETVDLSDTTSEGYIRLGTNEKGRSPIPSFSFIGLYIRNTLTKRKQFNYLLSKIPLRGIAMFDNGNIYHIKKPEDIVLFYEIDPRFDKSFNLSFANLIGNIKKDSYHFVSDAEVTKTKNFIIFKIEDMYYQVAIHTDSPLLIQSSIFKEQLIENSECLETVLKLNKPSDTSPEKILRQAEYVHYLQGFSEQKVDYVDLYGCQFKSDETSMIQDASFYNGQILFNDAYVVGMLLKFIESSVNRNYLERVSLFEKFKKEHAHFSHEERTSIINASKQNILLKLAKMNLDYIMKFKDLSEQEQQDFLLGLEFRGRFFIDETSLVLWKGILIRHINKIESVCYLIEDCDIGTDAFYANCEQKFSVKVPIYFKGIRNPSFSPDKKAYDQFVLKEFTYTGSTIAGIPQDGYAVHRNGNIFKIQPSNIIIAISYEELKTNPSDFKQYAELYCNDDNFMTNVKSKLKSEKATDKIVQLDKEKFCLVKNTNSKNEALPLYHLLPTTQLKEWQTYFKSIGKAV